MAVLASALRMYFMNQGKDVKIDEVTLERQCDHEYLEETQEAHRPIRRGAFPCLRGGGPVPGRKIHENPCVPGRGHLFYGSDGGARASGASAARGAVSAFLREPEAFVLCPGAPRGSSTGLAEAPPAGNVRSTRTWTAAGSSSSIGSRNWAGSMTMNSPDPDQRLVQQSGPADLAKVVREDVR